MKSIMKRVLTCMLALALVLAFMPAMPGGQASAVSFIDVSDEEEFTVNTSSPVYYRFDASEWPKTTREGVFFKAISCGGSPKVTQVDKTGYPIGNSNDMWGGRVLNPIVVQRADFYDGTEFDYVYFKIEGGLGSKFKIYTYPYAYNQDKSNAAEISDNTGIRDFGYLGYRDSSSYGTLWYKLNAKEKAKYRIHSNIKYYYMVDDEDATYVSDAADKTVTLEKGQTLYIEQCPKDGDSSYLELSRDIFNRMTSFSWDKGTYSITEGSSTTATLKYDRLDTSRDLESTIVAYEEFNVGDGGSLSYASGCELELQSKDNSKATFSLKGLTPGKYLILAKNSEGLMPQAQVEVKPKKMNVKGASSEGTHKSSKVHWGTQTGASKYAVYLKNSKGTYVKKGTTTKNDYNITGLSANKTYYVKIAPVKTGSFNGSSYSIEGAKSDAIKIVTAPSKAPKITSAKATGTKYHKATKTWHPGHWDAGNVWHDGYYTTTSAYSTAAVKVKHKKVSGATSYASNGISFSKGIAGYKISGKVKAGKKQTVKIRAVKKSGSSVAYGPWSKSKTVKLKGAK